MVIITIQNKPVNCSKCGLVLFKIDDSNEEGPQERSIIVKCRCGSLQRVSIALIPQIKVESVDID